MGAEDIYSQLKQLALINFFDNGTEDAVEENTFGHNHEERFVHFMGFIKALNTSKNGGQKIQEKK